jgi:deazaflavin-dependent oxidoreductase (nitroreductase family)
VRPDAGRHARCDNTGVHVSTASASLTRHLANPPLRAVLRSPLHRVCSGSLLVLSYTGRHSGKWYSIPLQYAVAGDELVLVAAHASDKAWWRNFAEAAPVTITLGGHRRRAVAELAHGLPQSSGLAAFRARFPRTLLGDDFEVVRLRLDDEPL